MTLFSHPILVYGSFPQGDSYLYFVVEATQESMARIRYQYAFEKWYMATWVSNNMLLQNGQNPLKYKDQHCSWSAEER